MDTEEGLSHDSDEGGPDKTNKEKEEEKGICLKTEGQDDYVFNSHSTSSETVPGKYGPGSSKIQFKELLSLASSSKRSSRGQISQGNKGGPELPAESELSCDQDVSMASLATVNETLNTGSFSQDSETQPEEAEKNISMKHVSSVHKGIEDEAVAYGSSIGHYLTTKNKEYGLTGTLYDVAMDAVTQSLSSMRNAANPRKKSPAWNHFFISPRDSTKAICMYCVKEFSRGKNEKDLSTSCLMRHVRRAHPTALMHDSEFPSSSLTSSFSPSLIPPPDLPNNRALASKVAPAAQKSTLTPASSTDGPDVLFKGISLVTPKLEKCAENNSMASPTHSSHNHSEGTAESLSEPIGTTSKNSNSRRRSAVWKHFYLSPADSSKAVCVHCMNEFSRGKNGKDLGTSCLIRHMWRAHRDIVIEENNQGSSIPPPYTTPHTVVSHFSQHDTGKMMKEPPKMSCFPDALLDEESLHFKENVDAKEDSNEVSYQSGQESSLDMSFGLKVCKDLPPSSSPDDLSEGPSLTEDLSSVLCQNKTIMKKLKAKVWHHFMVSPADQMKALCRYCPCVISKGKSGDFGTSCLMRHLMRRHPDVLRDQIRKYDMPLSHSPHATLTAAEAQSSKVSARPTNRNTKRLPVTSKKTSKLWNHFSFSASDPTKVVCLHCNRTISRGKKATNLGTSCLFRHIQRFHGHVLESNGSNSCVVSSSEIKEKQEVTDTSSIEENNEKFDEFHPIARKITKLVAEMLVLDLQPSALVENVGLNRLLEYLQPQYSLPSSSFFRNNAIPEMYERVKEVVITHMKEAENNIVHFTTSIWISSQTREYLTLTAHWVTYNSYVQPQGQDFHCSALLSISQIDCDYNMVNIEKHLEYLWGTWICSSGLKIGFIVTDNESLGKTLDNSNHTVVHCFEHSIDLIVTEALKSQRMVQNLLSIARKICERIYRSAKAKEKLVELQKVYGLPENPLLQDIPSKWKTSLYMLERLLEQKKAIDEMSVECGFREMISCDQWEVLHSVCSALKPFEVACREMSNRTATLGQVIPLIHILNRKIDMLFDETVGIDNMVKSLKEAMASRMSSILCDPRYMWATMLDPRYKTSLFTEEEAQQCKQDLIQELEASLSTSAETKGLPSNGCSEVPDPASNRDLGNNDNFWALMDNIRNKIKKEEQPKSSELAVLEYLEEDILDQSCDPLEYWNLKKFLWPVLAKVAVRYVGCPPSTVPAEMLFNTTSTNCSLTQLRPLLENMEELVFLKFNLPLVCFQY
ncbi:zinc finger BED domain-containing protein 4 [Scleropages formosus]|uniref:Zinc finger, BED-type containing 4 n=1 Tax=Scleropages formosus TaxID=113540 RepID=A0A8C9SI75_SCLFO|nr:zinc finger BED domain-containing protein 4 [Scleropages formosus]